MVDFVAFMADPASGRYLRLSFESALTDAGGTINLALGGLSFDCSNCDDLTPILSGYVTSMSAVPEPETYAMMLAGLGLLGFAARRRKQTTAV